MFAILPLIALVLLTLILQKYDSCWRSSVLSAAIAWGVLFTAITETLSWFRALTLAGLLGAWILVNLGLAVLYFQLTQKRKSISNLNQIHASSNQKFIARIHDLVWQVKLPPISLVLLGGIVFITATVGLIAIIAPPHTWDSMTYHMSRVAHWAQNQSVAHYPTYNLPQLFHPPFAEFAILNLQILSGGDRFANLVQWFSMLGSIIGVSLIAKHLGADLRGQLFASVFTASIPMGILQSSSTQNDYVVSFWVVCLAYNVLRSVQEKLNLIQSTKIGASLGLAILTKGTAYLFAFPFMLWLFLAKLRRLGLRLWQPLLVISVVFLALNLNHYLRNLDLFGSLLGTPPIFAKEYKIELHSISALLSNILRNASLHGDIIRHLHLQNFITPITGALAKVIRIAHDSLGLDMNDPRTTWPPGSYQVPGLSFDENIAGNPLQFCLIGLAIALFLIWKPLRTQKLLLAYASATLGIFLLICFLLKIQPYHSRHHLVLFILFSAFAGVVFSQAFNRYVVNALAVILIVTAMPWVFNNNFRPLVGEKTIFNTSRIDQFFVDRTHLEIPYKQAVNQVQGSQCIQVGLWLGTESSVGNAYWEYPFWALFNQNSTSNITIEHINVRNISAKKSSIYPHNQFTPCAILSVKTKNERAVQSQPTVIQGQTFVPTWSNDAVTLFVKQ